jgi:hypothetical protein
VRGTSLAQDSALHSSQGRGGDVPNGDLAGSREEGIASQMLSSGLSSPSSVRRGEGEEEAWEQEERDDEPTATEHVDEEEEMEEEDEDPAAQEEEDNFANVRGRHTSFPASPRTRLCLQSGGGL